MIILIIGKFKLYYLYRYILWKLGDTSPLTAVLKVTHECNLKCIHCPWRKWKVKDMSTKRWLKIIEEAREKGCILCIIEGGEPLLRKDLNVLIRHAKNMGMLVVVITNGMLDFSSYNPDVFWLSIDGVNETYEKIRGKGTFTRLVKNIKKNKKKKIITLATLSKVNVHDIENISEFFSPIVDGIWFNFIYPYKDVKKIALNKKDRIKAAKKILSIKSKYKIINSDSFLGNHA